MPDNNLAAEIRDLIQSQFAETNKKIESIQSTLDREIVDIRNDITKHSERLDVLEKDILSNNVKIEHELDSLALQLEIMKQERLRNNVRFTGLPDTAFARANQTILEIISILQIPLLPSDITVYADRNKSSIITSFVNYSQKRNFS